MQLARLTCADPLKPQYGDALKREWGGYVELRLQKVTVENYLSILARSEEIHDRSGAQAL